MAGAGAGAGAVAGAGAGAVAGAGARSPASAPATIIITIIILIIIILNIINSSSSVITTSHLSSSVNLPPFRLRRQRRPPVHLRRQPSLSRGGCNSSLSLKNDMVCLVKSNAPPMCKSACVV